MKYQLFDYQRDAALGCVKQLRRGGRDWQEDRALSSFALSAITGAGKTVIATAVIEALAHGSSDLAVEADPRACFLWVTDDPALNRQTRNKMLAASDLLQPSRLIELGNDFLDSELSSGRVYFINIQKLSKNSGLAQGGRNLRQYSFWDVLANTVRSGVTDLYLVVDEAHRGVKPATDRATIVQRLISGHAGSNPPAPMVWGISATIARFTKAMEGVSGRTAYPHVEVDIERVRASGLIKDEIGLDEPDEKGAFGTTLLREATKAVRDYDRRWAEYSASQHQPLVLPVMVVQVADKASDAHLTEMVQVIESEWPGLPHDGIAHVFGEHERLHLGGRSVDWISPESIENDTSVRVVLAKTAISTGWDCPRAEVLYSERPASDATHIAQIIGRMVRSPLAQRVATDDTLNSVVNALQRVIRESASRGVVRDPASIRQFQEELGAHERELTGYQARLAELRQQAGQGRIASGFDDASVFDDQAVREQYKQLLAKEVELASRGAAGNSAAQYAQRIAPLLRSADEVEARYQAALRDINHKVDEKSKALLLSIAAEESKLGEFNAQLQQLDEEARLVVGHVAMRNFGLVRDRMRSIVMHAEVGITEQAWETRESQLIRVRRLQSERARSERLLDEELREVLDDAMDE